MSRELSKLFEMLVEELKKYIELPNPKDYKMMGIWIMGTYIYQIFKSYPYLYLTGIKESGKTKALYLLSLICHKPCFLSSITTAALFRIINSDKPTLLLDELESLSKERMEETRLILQAGYKKGSMVVRCNEREEYRPEYFNVYCPKAMASIRYPNDIMESRSIIIIMKRTYNIGVSIKEVDAEEKKWGTIKKALENTMLNQSSEISELEKISEIGSVLYGRERELWKPILLIARNIDEGLYEEMFSYAVDRFRERLEDEEGTIKIRIVRVLQELVVEDGYYSNKEILDALGDDVDTKKFGKVSLGYQLKGLGIKNKRTAGGVKYLITVDDVKDLSQRLGINYELVKNMGYDSKIKLWREAYRVGEYHIDWLITVLKMTQEEIEKALREGLIHEVKPGYFRVV